MVLQELVIQSVKLPSNFNVTSYVGRLLMMLNYLRFLEVSCCQMIIALLMTHGNVVQGDCNFICCGLQGFGKDAGCQVLEQRGELYPKMVHM
jgi:hypothetical protein